MKRLWQRLLSLPASRKSYTLHCQELYISCSHLLLDPSLSQGELQRGCTFKCGAGLVYCLM
eukprot:6051981-Amphidinium_carterae.1